jgi:3-deoxy-manno-octulosonate cytidylyltransferase (CMP-KDO synthetase)
VAWWARSFRPIQQERDHLRLSRDSNQRVLAVIPARLASTRLPNKVLLPIAGVPMLGWVYRAAQACAELDRVVIATDASEVAAYAASEGWPCIMTPSTLASGTDRVHAVAAMLDADIYVNIQGDEPLVRREHIEALLRPFGCSDAEVTTVSTPCSPEQIQNPNAVKVVTARDGRALYFSRAAIPYLRDKEQGKSIGYQKHIGIYAYRKATLIRFAQLPPSPLECAERLEQLRMLENGISVYVEPTAWDTIGVDTEDDLRAAEEMLIAASGLPGKGT